MTLLENQSLLSKEDLAARALAQSINTVIGVAETVLTKPAGSEGKPDLLYLKANIGTWLVRLGVQITATFTAATSDEITKTGHLLETGDGPYRMTNSGGALPAGLAVDTDYFIVKTDDDDFRVALTHANAVAATPVVVDITGTGTGTHTLVGMPTVVTPTATTTDGLQPWKLLQGDEILLAGPEQVTVRSFNAADELTYYHL